MDEYTVNFGLMLLCLGNVTDLLGVTPSNPVPHPLSLHPFYFMLFKVEYFVAKQHPTNSIALMPTPVALLLWALLLVAGLLFEHMSMPS